MTCSSTLRAIRTPCGTSMGHYLVFDATGELAAVGAARPWMNGCGRWCLVAES